MVAISLYKGNLHRAPDTPRRWLMPTRKISPTDFKTLLNRRSRALSRLQSNPNPNPNPQSNGGDLFKPDENGNHDDWSVLPNDELVATELAVLPENDANAAVEPSPPNDAFLNEKENRKKEVEEKLKVLNERKHKLVQVLKQILNAEEELRRRSNVQGITGRPSVSLQVDVTNDFGSMSRHVTPRPGSEGVDAGGADADDVSNHNMHSRNMTRMSNMSPSSESLPRRAPFSMFYEQQNKGVADFSLANVTKVNVANTIATATSMRAILKSNCYHDEGHDVGFSSCSMQVTSYCKFCFRENKNHTGGL